MEGERLFFIVWGGGSECILRNKIFFVFCKGRATAILFVNCVRLLEESLLLSIVIASRIPPRHFETSRLRGVEVCFFLFDFVFKRS